MKSRYCRAILAAVALTGWTALTASAQLPPQGYEFAAASPQMTTATLTDVASAAPVTFIAGEGKSACESDGTAKCKAGCKSCGWGHKIGVFAEYLHMRPRDAEVAFAAEVSGIPSVSVGRTGMTDGDFTAAFRGGVTYVLDPSRSVTMQYTLFESNEGDAISAGIGNDIQSLVGHPLLFIPDNFSDATASHSIDFDLIDMDYRHMFDCCERQQLNLLLGARYSQMEQSFSASFTGNGTQDVDTTIEFYGLGLKAGLEGERYTKSNRYLVYGSLIGSLMAGEFEATYNESVDLRGTDSGTTWEAGRLVPTLDLELGAGWQSQCGTWRITGGYMFSSWFNVIKTDNWIKGFQSSNFVDMGDSMTFDGFVAKIEGRF